MGENDNSIFEDGDWVKFKEVEGMKEINKETYLVKKET